MGHYAVRNKARLFRLFDEGKRPSDIADLSVSRITLYQYYAEWRREKGIKGKQTGFAVKQYRRNAGDAKEEKEALVLQPADSVKETVPYDAETLARERKKLDNFILDSLAVVDAIKRPRPGAVFLPGSRKERHLADILQHIKERNTAKVVFLSMEQYADIFNKWIDIAKKAGNTDEFYVLSSDQGLNYEAPGL